jgi:hypothetical protein
VIWELSENFLSCPKKLQIWAFLCVVFRILNARNLFFAARAIQICAFDVVWELSANFLSCPKKVANLSISVRHVSHSKCSKSLLRSARYSDLCFLRRSVRVLCLSARVRAGKHVSEDVVGREWLKEETLVSCKLGHRQTSLP